VQNLNLLVSGLTLGAIYALVALGFHLVFKMTGIIDFAQGDKVVVGGLIALSLVQAGVSNIVVLLVILLAIGLVLGVIYDWAVIRPTSRNGSVAAVAATVGMALVFANGHALIWGPDAQPFPPVAAGSFEIGGVRVLYQSLLIWGVLLATGLAIGFLVERTRTGRGMIAAATDPLAATAVGINVARSRAISFALAFGLATVAGVLVAPITLAGGGSLGLSLTLKGFTGAVLGGLESTKGVLIGALLLGVVESQLAVYLPSNLVDPVVFGLLIVVLLVMPNGIFGRRSRLA
jgi:branched-subunit amino acid ABC-type transport system permease component